MAMPLSAPLAEPFVLPLPEYLARVWGEDYGSSSLL